LSWRLSAGSAHAEFMIEGFLRKLGERGSRRRGIPGLNFETWGTHI
jgi:hypothetical protein